MARKSKYPVELKERAVAMVRDLERELGPGRGAIARVAKHLGLHPETVRQWVRDDDKGKRPSGERVAGSEADKDASQRPMSRGIVQSACFVCRSLRLPACTRRLGGGAWSRCPDADSS